MKLSPAVLRALAYCYATGYLPKGLHLDTWMKAQELIDGEVTHYRPKAEVMKQVVAQPMAKAHDFLTALGFVSDNNHRSSARYVGYRHPTLSCEALSYRSGGATIIRVNDAVPYRQSWHVSEKDI
jgi:hypothetical protein